MQSDHTYHRVREVAATLCTSTDTVLRLIRSGRLRACNAGLSSVRPRWIVADADLRDFLRQRSNLPVATTTTTRPPRAKKSTVPDYF